MPHEPSQVIEAVNRHWSSTRRGRLLGPSVTGPGRARWSEEMRSQMKAIQDVLQAHFAAPTGEHPTPAALRARRRSVQAAIREASRWPYKKATPLFVSEWFVISILEPHRLQRFVKEERDYTGEHVIPLNSTVSATQLLGNPGGYAAPVAEAMTGPMCEVIGYEDRRILRLLNLNPDRPFQRYDAPYRGESIVVYRITDGIQVDPATFGWNGWCDYMRKVPLYQEGLQFSERFAEHWAEMLDPQLTRRMVDVGTPPDEPTQDEDDAEQQEEELGTEHVVVGIRREELNTIEAELLEVLQAACLPETRSGFPRLRIPVRCSRVSIVLRNWEGQDLLTLTIGPERRKLDLYHCSGRGGAHVREGEQVLRQVEAALLTLFPNTKLAPLPSTHPVSSVGHRPLYEATPSVEASVESARRCIQAMLHVCR
jgi:hypothetical protein